jgi:hypothetical protein
MSFSLCKGSAGRGFGKLIFKIELLGLIGSFFTMGQMKGWGKSELPR